MNDLNATDQIYRFMTAYPFEAVKAAFVLLNRERLQVKTDIVEAVKQQLKASGWEEYDGAPGDVPPGMEWHQIADKVYVRTPVLKAPPEASAVDLGMRKKAESSRKKTDLSMKPTDKVCPLCGEVMAWEPICPGCKLGRQGFRGRYVCMAEWDHTFYMTREGVDLPNR
jgi:hypothetical protein